MRTRRAQERGQGTVELALGLTLFVPVLMIGWAFAEHGFLALKVHEASESALWDSTSFPSAGNLEAARADAETRYADFDGRLSTALTQRVGVATQSGTLTVECGTVGMTMPQPALVELVLPGPVGASCTARATTTLFAGGTVFGKPWTGITIPTCSSGRPDGFGGACRGQPALAMNDGALQDHSNCDVSDDGTPCGNTEYFKKVETLFKATGGAQGADALYMLRDTLNGGMGGLPIGANTALDTYLSSWGEDAPVMPFAQENKHQADGDEKRWFTTPFQQSPSSMAAWGARQACYLGIDCDSTSIDKP